jgi:septal ring factor EnvC (AmiA/AmiB activator)
LKKSIESKKMNILSMKKKYLFSFFIFPVLIHGTGCVCATHQELSTRNEEIKSVKLDIQLKEKTIAGLLDRLSLKDQEIGRLTDELHATKMTIEDLKSDIEKLREVDVQMEEKKKEVDDSIEETISVNVPEATPVTEPTTGGEESKTE